MVNFLLLENYKIYFLLKNQNHYGKVFKITENKISPNSTIEIIKKHSFKVISTRKYNLGNQFVSLILNGIESEKIKFVLK